MTRWLDRQNFYPSELSEKETTWIERQNFTPTELLDTPSEPIKSGVYVIRSISGYYKIGHTNDISNRLHTFTVKLPFEIELEVWILAEDCRGLEAWMHRHFASKRVNGEWFSLNNNDLEYLKDLEKIKQS